MVHIRIRIQLNRRLSDHTYRIILSVNTGETRNGSSMALTALPEYTNLPAIEIKCDSTTLREDIFQVVRTFKPDWTFEKVQFKAFAEGITNKIYGIWCEDGVTDIQEIRQLSCMKCE